MQDFSAFKEGLCLGYIKRKSYKIVRARVHAMSVKVPRKAILIALLAAIIVIASVSAYLFLLPPKVILPPERRVRPIVLITLTEGADPVSYQAAFWIAEEWKKLGFEVKVLPLDPPTIDKKTYYEWDFDVTIFGWGARADRLDPNLFLGLITTGEIGKKGEGANNPTGYSNPEYDKLYDMMRMELDIEKRRKLAFKLQEIFAEDVPRPIFYHEFLIVAYNNKKWENIIQMPGEPIFNYWQPYFITPKVEEKVLKLGANVEPDSLNPLAATLIFSWHNLRLFYDNLVRLTPEAKPIPWAAESIKIIDPTTIDVTIRNGMKFHDGKPVTVDDVKFSFDYMIQQEFMYFRPFWLPIKEVKIVGERTVRFILKAPDAAFLTNSLSMIPILPKHLWEGIKEPAELKPHEVPMIGSGIFKNPVWVRGEYIKMDINAEHFAYKGIEIEGFKLPPVKIDGMLLKIYGDLEGVVTGLKLGEIDATAVSLKPGHLDVLVEPWITIIKARNFGFMEIIFNLRRSPFDDVNVRRALVHAIPLKKIIEVLLKGLGERGYIIAPVNAFWHNPDVRIYEYNLELAREILKAAGYEWDAEGRIYYPKDYVPKFE